MDNDEVILSYIQQNGYAGPSDLYKLLNTNTIFASAMLGDLVSKGKLKVTFLKRGTSPFYYLEETKEKLQDLGQYLNDKDKLVYEKLKEEKVLKDSNEIPLFRVALRNIKDYAVPLTITYQNQQHLFWKWYMLSNAEAEEYVRKLLTGISEPVKKEESPQPIEQQATLQKEEPKKKPARKQTTKKPVEKKEPLKEEQKPLEKKQIKTTESDFEKTLQAYAKKNNITILSIEPCNKRNTEFDLVIEVPSAVGTLQYYCKAKSKKKINDSDIAGAVVEGQQRKLPTLVLITGDMTKKSQTLLETKFKGTTVQKI